VFFALNWKSKLTHKKSERAIIVLLILRLSSQGSPAIDRLDRFNFWALPIVLRFYASCYREKSDIHGKYKSK
jgi:hypothetical protein